MQTVGEILRAQREKKGLSIKDIELGTSIRSLYIKAIENNDYNIVPGEVYLKGFIRNYANYLGMDAESVMEVYRQSKNPEPQEKSVPAVQNPQKEIQEDTAPKASRAHSSNKSSFLWPAILCIAVLAAGAVWWFGFGKTPDVGKETKPAPVAPAAPAPAVPAPAPQAAPVPQVQAKPVMLSAKFTADCWTLVTADGKEIYQGTVKAGETLKWEAEKSITLKAGNAGAIDLTYNGQSAGKLGENGEVVEKTFTAKK